MIDIRSLTKVYPTKRGAVGALRDATLTINQGEFVVVKGPSGCGKTTLLLALGGMARPSAGSVTIDGTDLYALSPQGRAAFRAQHIGFVFQLFHLVPYLNVTRNVLLAAHGQDKDSEANALLTRLGLSHRVAHKPAELSAGERQRTAIARALLNQPKVVLADEPTGNLDPENAAEVMRHLAEYREQGGTVIVATHGTDADAHATRTLRLAEGTVVEDSAD